MLGQYTNKKQSLIEIYNMLINSKSEFIDADLKTQLLEKKDALLNDKFILAVAGQMKAGKSTLLNAMIFGDEILPADDTELTAKITLITFDEKPSFEAILYNQIEFNDLRISLKGTSDEDEFNNLLNDSLQSLQNKGYSTYEELLNKKTIKGTNFKELINYVGKNGMFTPFVNTLILKTNSKWVKDIIVVDTPGMNSPNKLRDQVVKDWIFKANAVIYCSYAGRAMDANDLKFIDDYMIHIQPNHRLIALTKSDLINGEEKLISTMESMIDSDWNRDRKLIPSIDSIFPVCQMAVLLEKMNKSKLHFTSRMEQEYNHYDSKNIFEHSISQFSKLEQGIEQKLIANKDENVIESNQNYLKTIFDDKLLEIKEAIDYTEKSFELLIANQDELKQKQSAIKKDIKLGGDKFDKLKCSILNLYNEEITAFAIRDNFVQTRSKIQAKLDKMTLKQLNIEASIIVNDEMSKYLNTLREQSNSFSSSFSKNLQTLFNKMEVDFDYADTDLLKEKIKIKCIGLINVKIETLKQEIYNSAGSLKKLYTNNVNWWSRNTSFDSTRGKQALTLFISEGIEPLVVKLGKEEVLLKTSLYNDVSDIIKVIEAQNFILLTEKLSEIEKLENKSSNEIESQKTIEKEKLNNLKESESKLEALITNISNKANH